MGTFQHAVNCCTSHSSCRVFQGSCFQLCCATGAFCSKRDTWQSSALEKETNQTTLFGGLSGFPLSGLLNAAMHLYRVPDTPGD